MGILLWTWVCVVFLAYIYQFQDEAASFARAVGLRG